MSIQQLATMHHVTPAAIRHYEKLGLFEAGHIIRRPNGYREFTKGASERLTLIKIGQLSGFTLREMATELRHWCDGGMSPAQKQQILAIQLQKIDQKMQNLHQTRQYIIEAVQNYMA